MAHPERGGVLRLLRGGVHQVQGVLLLRLHLGRLHCCCVRQAGHLARHPWFPVFTGECYYYGVKILLLLFWSLVTVHQLKSLFRFLILQGLIAKKIPVNVFLDNEVQI